MVISEWRTFPGQDGKPVTVRNIWHWDPKDDGTIHNWGFWERQDKLGELNKYFDILYRRSAIGGSTFQLTPPKAEDD